MEENSLKEKKGQESGRKERGKNMKFLVNAQIANVSGKGQNTHLILEDTTYVTFNLFTFQAVFANISIDIPCTYNGEHVWDSFWLTEFEQKQVKAIISFLFWEP